eukprot:4541309-Ditylum_brightwellii.AAC.2
MVVTRLMKLMAPTLWSSRTSVTPSMLVTGRNPGNQHNCAKGPNKHSDWLSNGNHRATTYRHPSRSNTSGHDGYRPCQDDNQHDSG